MKRAISVLLLIPVLLSAVGTRLLAQGTKRAAKADPPESPRALMGAGNFNNGSVDANATAQFKLLKAVGGTRCRVNLYPSVYLLNNDWEKPNPACMDAILQAAHDNGVTPMILFETYIFLTR